MVGSELEGVRNKVFNYAVETLSETIVNEKLNLLFNKLKYAAEVNLVFGFSFKNIEDGGFRYFYPKENNTLLGWSKIVCTLDNLAKLNDILHKSDVIESCSRERLSTKCRFFKLSNLTVFFAFFKDVPMGCKDKSYRNVFWEVVQSTVSGLKKIQDNHITTTCVFSCSCPPIARKSTFGRRNFKIVQSIHQ